MILFKLFEYKENFGRFEILFSLLLMIIMLVFYIIIEIVCFIVEVQLNSLPTFPKVTPTNVETFVIPNSMNFLKIPFKLDDLNYVARIDCYMRFHDQYNKRIYNNFHFQIDTTRPSETSQNMNYIEFIGTYHDDYLIYSYISPSNVSTKIEVVCGYMSKKTNQDKERLLFQALLTENITVINHNAAKITPINHFKSDLSETYRCTSHLSQVAIYEIFTTSSELHQYFDTENGLIVNIADSTTEINISCVILLRDKKYIVTQKFNNHGDSIVRNVKNNVIKTTVNNIIDFTYVVRWTRTSHVTNFFCTMTSDHNINITYLLLNVTIFTYGLSEHFTSNYVVNIKGEIVTVEKMYAKIKYSLYLNRRFNNSLLMCYASNPRLAYINETYILPESSGIDIKLHDHLPVQTAYGDFIMGFPRKIYCHYYNETCENIRIKYNEDKYGLVVNEVVDTLNCSIESSLILQKPIFIEGNCEIIDQNNHLILAPFHITPYELNQEVNLTIRFKLARRRIYIECSVKENLHLNISVYIDSKLWKRSLSKTEFIDGNLQVPSKSSQNNISFSYFSRRNKTFNVSCVAEFWSRKKSNERIIKFNEENDPHPPSSKDLVQRYLTRNYRVHLAKRIIPILLLTISTVYILLSLILRFTQHREYQLLF